MIRELSISNLGVISSTQLTLSPGLTVLTGETGAGKTLITTAVSQLLGAKPDPGLVRSGTAEAVIDCALEVRDADLAARLTELGAAVEDGEVLVTRTISSRSKAIVGGRSVAASVLSELVGTSVTLHGQHGQTRLTRPSEQRTLLDAKDPSIGELLQVARQAWLNLRDAEAQLQVALSERETSERDLSMWKALVADVESVAPEPGEDEALDARIAMLSSLDAIQRAARGALTLLTEGDDADVQDVASLLNQARKQLETRSETREFAEWTARAIEIVELVQSLGHDIDRFVSALDDDPQALDTAMSRRAQIGALLRRHGCSLAELLERSAEAGRRLALANDPEARSAELERLHAHCAQELELACAALHDRRVAVSVDVAALVTAELRALGLTHARFDIEVTRQGSPTQFGDDAVEFTFTANPGQTAQPLAQVASGGELSRVMLALETAGVSEQPRCFIFDEVDAGVGGRAALEVGRRLSALAERQQVIVVTHLAQVAAFADAHIVVEKTVAGEVTSTAARLLATEERPRELARMLSGLEDSSTANAHARELLEEVATARRHSG